MYDISISYFFLFRSNSFNFYGILLNTFFSPLNAATIHGLPPCHTYTKNSMDRMGNMIAKFELPPALLDPCRKNMDFMWILRICIIIIVIIFVHADKRG